MIPLGVVAIVFSVSLMPAGQGTASARLPGSIACCPLVDGRNVYVIRDLRVELGPGESLDNEALRRTGLLAPTDSVAVDAAAGTFVLVSARDTIAVRALIDRLARSSGVVPYWSELEVRDERSPEATPDLYEPLVVRLCRKPVPAAGARVVRHMPTACVMGLEYEVHEERLVLTATREVLRGHAVVDSVGSDEQWRRDNGRPGPEVDLTLPGGAPATARLNRVTAYCMGEPKLRLRVYGSDGRWLWADAADLHGRCTLFAPDLDGDGADEIVVIQESHCEISLFVFAARPATPRRD